MGPIILTPSGRAGGRNSLAPGFCQPVSSGKQSLSRKTSEVTRDFDSVRVGSAEFLGTKPRPTTDQTRLASPISLA
ncbi:MAG: hypothetical protein ACK56I_18265, partial [bacterium]